MSKMQAKIIVYSVGALCIFIGWLILFMIQSNDKYVYFAIYAPLSWLAINKLPIGSGGNTKSNDRNIKE